MLFEIIYVMIGAIVAIALLNTIKGLIPEIKKNMNFDKFQTLVTISVVVAGVIVIWPLIIITVVISNARSRS